MDGNLQFRSFPYSRFFSQYHLFLRGWTKELIRKFLTQHHKVVLYGNTYEMYVKKNVYSAEELEAVTNGIKESRGNITDTDAVLLAVEHFDLVAKTRLYSGKNREIMLSKLIHEAIMKEMVSQVHPTADMTTAAHFVAKALELLSPSSDVQNNSTRKSKSKPSIQSILSGLCSSAAQIGRNLDKHNTMRFISYYPDIILQVAQRYPQEAIDTYNLNWIPELSFEPVIIKTKKAPMKKVDEIISRHRQYELKAAFSKNDYTWHSELQDMYRQFIIHVGGTNTGKTYQGFKRLIEAKTGIYIAPLRLLALEGQDTLLNKGVPCSLTTGEESDVRPWDTHICVTPEVADLSRNYDVAVIDECQMIADKQRGYAWTRAILGIKAKEIHLCVSPEGIDLVRTVLKTQNESYEIVKHERKVPLLCMEHEITLEEIQPGDALIFFSKLKVLALAEQLKRNGKETAIIYGALPSATRRKQMQLFLEGKLTYIVATDAIGMGLNLPIKRVLFMETDKFDGERRRKLTPSEVRQIAGRAGRYKMYDVGFVGAIGCDLAYIRNCLSEEIQPFSKAVVDYTWDIIDLPYDNIDILKTWAELRAKTPFIKRDVYRQIQLIEKLRENSFSLSKQDEFLCSRVSFDVNDGIMLKTFFSLLRKHLTNRPIYQPRLYKKGTYYSLEELEEYSKKLDLYYSFCRIYGYEVDEEKLMNCREYAAEKINRILLYHLRHNIRYCEWCGNPLPSYTQGRLCATCYKYAAH